MSGRSHATKGVGVAAVYITLFLNIKRRAFNLKKLSIQDSSARSCKVVFDPFKRPSRMVEHDACRLGAAFAYNTVFRSRRCPSVTPDNAFDFQSGRLP